MEQLIEVIRTGSYQQKRAIGVYDLKRSVTEHIKQMYPDWEDRSVLDGCYWQLSRFYRVCQSCFDYISLRTKGWPHSSPTRHVWKNPSRPYAGS